MAAMGTIRVGNVVRVDGTKKRWLVVAKDQITVRDTFTLQALSGGMAGSSYSGIIGERLELDADQSVNFSGKSAEERRDRVLKSLIIGTGRMTWRTMPEVFAQHIDAMVSTVKTAPVI
jgi:hypothetical protein